MKRNILTITGVSVSCFLIFAYTAIAQTTPQEAIETVTKATNAVHDKPPTWWVIFLAFSIAALFIGICYYQLKEIQAWRTKADDREAKMFLLMETVYKDKSASEKENAILQTRSNHVLEEATESMNGLRDVLKDLAKQKS
jgi:hypothetical protein